MNVWRIQALRRWGSDAVKGYLRGAQNAGLVTLSAEANLGKSLEASRAELLSLQGLAKKLRSRLSQAIQQSEQEIPNTAMLALPALTPSDVLDGAAVQQEEDQTIEEQALPYMQNTKLRDFYT